MKMVESYFKTGKDSIRKKLQVYLTHLCRYMQNIVCSNPTVYEIHKS